ncbi:hypothetical protein JTE90_009307 [Oedothorax gibbosus]|uniref:Integrase zinc-binding domain-containing protein n=1 Tax=Oedothorax gibbosus TaxID=931172 RepID=A0AAV6TPQ9_9ARAC|nr:hypothetical protein JTE90_009307 [Oedothorax gibbosus]
MDKTGVERLLLVVPKKYRNDLKAFCHEGTSGHLGVTKTKDIFSRHFFWPSVIKKSKTTFEAVTDVNALENLLTKEGSYEESSSDSRSLFQDKCRLIE